MLVFGGSMFDPTFFLNQREKDTIPNWWHAVIEVWRKDAESLAHDLQQLRAQLAQTMEAAKRSEMGSIAGLDYRIILEL